MDYAAGAPVFPVASKAREQAEKQFSNASSIHKDGVVVREAIETARKAVAESLHAGIPEIIFTSTGTESDNLAILGAVDFAVINNGIKNPHIITLITEHPAVIERYKYLEKKGITVTYVSVGSDGRVDPKDIRDALRPETILVSVMYANNEIGVVQPIREIAKEIRHWKKTNTKYQTPNTYPLFHTDACQAAGYLNMNTEQLGVDLMSFSGIKLGGGHGAAVLYVKRGTPISPIMFGGGQEQGFRPGTENMPAIVALSTALTETEKIKEKEVAFLQILQSYFISELQNTFSNVRLNGSEEFRLPNNVHVSFPNISSELLVLELDAKGISASAGSACDSAKDVSSHVLEALYGKDDAKSWGSVRFSFGYKTTKKEIHFVIKKLELILEKYSSFKDQS